MDVFAIAEGARYRFTRSVSSSIVETDKDPTFDPEEELASTPALKLETFVEEWVISLERDDKIALGLFFTFNLKQAFNCTSTKAAEYAAMMMSKSEHTIRQWKSDFMDNGKIPNNKQGRYQRTGLLWSSESLKQESFIIHSRKCQG